jgi:hypothetical protein
MRRAFALVCFVSALGCAPSDAPCSIDVLQRALDDATPGSVVSFGACELHGSLSVPAGVELRGAGTERSHLVTSAGAALTLLDEGAQVSQLRISSRGLVAVRKLGSGDAFVMDVEIEALRGVGILVREGALSASRVAVKGALSSIDFGDPVYGRVIPGPESATMEIRCGGSSECTPGQSRASSCSIAEHCAELQICDACGLFATWTSTHAILVGEGATLDLVDSTVAGWAEYGLVALPGASVSLERVIIEEILGIGLFASGAEVDLQEVEVRDTSSGLRGSTSAGIAADGSIITARGLRIYGTEGVGFVVSSSRADLETIEIVRSDQEGMLLFATELTHVRGPGSRFIENRGAGILVSGGSLIHASDLTIESTRPRPYFIGAGVISIGDGLLGTSVVPGSTLTRVSLSRNARVQLTIVAPSIDEIPMTFTDVMVDGLDMQRGAVIGPLAAEGVRALPNGTWSAGITRLGTTAANDAARASEAMPIVSDATPDSVRHARERIGIVMPIM